MTPRSIIFLPKCFCEHEEKKKSLRTILRMALQLEMLNCTELASFKGSKRPRGASLRCMPIAPGMLTPEQKADNADQWMHWVI